MNLLALTDHKLSDLRQQVVQEMSRRSKAAVENSDTATIIHGNEMAKRALVVAVAGGHSILFVGPSNCGKTMMRAAALELDLTQTLEYRCCTCGNYSDPRADCRCTARQIDRHLRKMPTADIMVEMQRPTHREIGTNGTTLDDMRQQIAGMSDHASTALGPHETSLMKAAVVETALDPAAQETVMAVARTIANLDNSERIEASHLMEAINYRPLATGVWVMLKETNSEEIMVTARTSPRFPLGQVVATPGALEALNESGESPAVFLYRHAGGDWGDVCDDDKRLNDEALENGGRLLSSYTTKHGEKIWVITESDRSATTILLPSEY